MGSVQRVLFLKFGYVCSVFRRQEDGPPPIGLPGEEFKELMCGLTGVVSARGVNPDASSFSAALQLLSHRGPDHEGKVTYQTSDRAVALGHKRLSIIDLSEAGHQPMRSSDGRYAMVFNGEIYNYVEIQRELEAYGSVFQTHSDTEVLIEAWARWGEEALAKLIGMFAFAVFDLETGDLTLVRDGFGIKPMFWSLDNDQLAFASEVGATLQLREAKAQPNHKVLAKYLVAGSYDSGPETFFEGVHRLEPGHFLSIQVGEKTLEPQIRRWWWPSIAQTGPRSIEESAEAIRELFLESVRLHLRSDVPLGFALSGGIDSSAVISAVRKLEPDTELKTFSFVAPGTDIDEEGWVDIVNSHVGAIPHKIFLGGRDLAADLDDMIVAQGEPFGGTSIYAQYAVYREAKRAGVTVTMDGQGADELFAGYHGYVDRRILSLIEELKFSRALETLSSWGDWPGRSKKAAIRSIVSAKLPPRIYRTVRSRLRRSSGGVNRAWIDREAWQSVEWGNALNSGEHRRRLAGALRGELTEGGLGNLLRHGDRNSMRWSIESRVPFLTIPLAEAALSLPEDHLLSRSGETKHVFRHAMRGIVPDEILDRRDKIGFQTPQSDWLLDLASVIETEWLEGLEKLEIIDSEVARSAIVSELREGRISAESWRFISAARWALLYL